MLLCFAVQCCAALRCAALTKIARHKGHGQEDDGDDSELSHALVLKSRNGIEDQINHIVRRAAHLVQRICDQQDMVLHVAQIDASRGINGDAGSGRIFVSLGVSTACTAGSTGALVIAQRIDKIADGLDVGAERDDFGNEYVDCASMFDGRGCSQLA